jgi:molybdate transport system substrate-binding protein
VTAGETLRILSAGAAKAVVLALAQPFRATAGVEIVGTFDAAGTIRAQFLANACCDVLILPEAMQHALAGERLVDATSIASLGHVPTGIAVPHGQPAPPIADADALRASLLQASAVYCPDTERATAGIHFMNMLRAMGIDARVASKVRAYANGAQAMVAMASAPDGRGAVGCTQATEILYTTGVALVGPLPAPFELSTSYAVAVAAASLRAVPARQFCSLVCGPSTRALREASGFLQTT